MRKLLIPLLLLLSFPVGAQTVATVNRFEKAHQSCLDKGSYMMGCALRFYDQMDSLLNLRYKQLRASCNNRQRENLKAEQLEWLADRERQLSLIKQRVSKEAKEEGFDGGQDEKMMIADENASIVKKRVVELINAKPENYSHKE